MEHFHRYPHTFTAAFEGKASGSTDSKPPGNETMKELASE